MFLEISKQWFLALYFSPSCGEYYNSTSIFLVSLWKFSKVQIPLYNYKFFILILLKMSFFFFNSQKAYFRKHNQVRHIKLLLFKKKNPCVSRIEIYPEGKRPQLHAYRLDFWKMELQESHSIV